MKFLQIISHYVPAYSFGGPLRVAHALSQSLIGLGHEVHVCTTNMKTRHTNLDVAEDIPVLVDNVITYYEPVWGLRSWGFSPALFRRVRSELIWADVALIHAHYQFANTMGAWLARNSHVPYVVFAHGSLHREGIAKRRWVKNLYLDILEDQNLHHARFIAFNAPEEQRLSAYSNLGKVIPSGIDPLEFESIPIKGEFRHKFSELQNKFLFLYLGRLSVKQKGLDMLIAAFSKVVNVWPQAHLVLAGPDENNGEDFLRKSAEVFGISNSVTFTGLLTGQDKLAALNDSDVFVLTSRYEGLSISLLEAMYMGLPVVVADGVGFSEQIRMSQCGLVISPDIDSIAYALCDMVATQNRSLMARRSRSLIQGQYTWPSIAKKLITEIRAGL